MKNLKRLFILVFALVLVIPFGVFAKEEEDVEEKEEVTTTGTVDNSKYAAYKTTNLAETLEAEDIELKNKDYTENSKQAIIYLFRGQGCGHCQEFLTFLSDLSEDYGEYFRLVAFETWQDEANKNLMSEISKSLGEEAGGVPYIVIGDKTFPGYASSYDSDIITAIMELYNTDVSKRADIFANKKEPKDHSVVVGTITLLVIGGIAAATIITRKNNG